MLTANKLQFLGMTTREYRAQMNPVSRKTTHYNFHINLAMGAGFGIVSSGEEQCVGVQLIQVQLSAGMASILLDVYP
jgi:hypothetical protein